MSTALEINEIAYFTVKAICLKWQLERRDSVYKHLFFWFVCLSVRFLS